MKQALLKLLYKHVISKISCYAEHSLEAFEAASKPITTILQSIDGIKIGKPYKVSDGGPEYYWMQTARQQISQIQHISISWRLQDTGGEPYPVVEMTKYVRFNTDRRDGIGHVGITSIYPDQIVNLPTYLKILQAHPTQFTNHESFSSHHSMCSDSPRTKSKPNFPH